MPGFKYDRRVIFNFFIFSKFSVFEKVTCPCLAQLLDPQDFSRTEANLVQVSWTRLCYQPKGVIRNLGDMRYDIKKLHDESGPAKPAEGSRAQDFIPKPKGPEACLVLNESDVPRLES